MTVGKAIFYLLDNSTDLTAIVGTRIYPEVAQQDAPLPYVVYNISNNEPSDTKREPSKMDTANIEVNCYSTSYTQVIDMSVAVRAALDRVTGTYSGVNVQSIAYMNEVIDFDEGKRAYNVSSDYDVRISRTDFEIAQGSPITGVDLGDLADVNTTGVTDGQVIAYDAATAVWLPATDAGGAEQLNDLSDVIISQPSTGEFFRYDGDEWVNDSANKSDVGLGNVDNTSDANKPVSTATQTALDLKADITSVPTELDDLNDVQIIGTPTLGQALVYGAGKWLPGAAGATELGDLDDVNTTGAGVGSLLTYNGASWDISGSQLPTDDIYFHQRYETESEALRTGATATTELYFTCTAQGNGLAESASSDTPTAGKIIKRKIYYSEEGFADPDTGTWVEFTPAPADDASFATVKAALLEYLKARTGGTVPISLKQTWEEVAAAPAFTGLLNETYGSGAEAAYSTRRLNGNVTDCMVIRRASDSTTTTIGFDASGNIDEAAIETFCTGTTCTVYQWLDQSGNGNTATAPSTGAEPTIYTGGALVKENGKVAVENVLSGAQGLNIPSFTINLSDFTCTLVSKFYSDSSTEGKPVMINGDTGATFDYRYKQFSITRNRFYLGTSTVQSFFNNVSYTSTNNLQLHTITPTNGYVDGTSAGTFGTAGEDLDLNPTFNYLISGDIGRDRGTHANSSEVIIWTAEKTSTDRTDIEENIGDYFTQNTPLLDTYSGAAAAYSLRLLDSTYTGSAIRVRRSSDNTEQDIGFNVFGELDTVALAAHCGSNDGFVSKFYDQSGNSITLDTVGTSAMPKIYDGATQAVVTRNDKPAIYFDGTDDYFKTTTSVVQSPVTFTSVFSDIPSYDFIIGSKNLGAFTLQTRPGNLTLWLGATTLSQNVAVSPNSQQVVFSAALNSTSQKLYANGSSTINTDTVSFGGTTQEFRIGYVDSNASGIMRGYVQEVILWSAYDDTNVTTIHSDVNTYYNIYS